MGVDDHEPTVVVPDDWQPTDGSPGPVFAFGTETPQRSVRDCTKPIGYDEHGNPLYAPPGLPLTRLP